MAAPKGASMGIAQRIGKHLRSRARVVAVSAASCAGVALFVVHGATTAPTVEGALAERLSSEGLSVDPSSVIFLGDDAHGLAPRSAIFLAQQGDEPADVYHAWVRSSGTTVLGVSLLSDITRTPGAAETHLVRAGEFAAFRVVVRERVEAVGILDLRGEPGSVTRSFSRVAKLQNAISNLQETGRFRGFGRRRYALVEPADTAELRAVGEAFELSLADATVRFDPRVDPPSAGGERVTLGPTDKGIPGGITWVVDTVRNLSFVGPEPIAWLENRVYGIKDRLQRLRYRLMGAPNEADDGGSTASRRPVSAAVIAELAAIGFPPPDLEPMIPDPGPGEGRWTAVVDDPFVGVYPNAAPAFAETSLRVDPERPYARVFMVAWDPRQVQLRAVSGTREPESANGAFGSGTIPRDPARLPRVVAAFNGGFQAMHGEFGMMADGIVYLPPKPYAATVGVMADGQVVMGSWLGLPEGSRVYTETAAMAQIPSGMVDFRQNLTSVVEGDTWNPWQRWYWGAAPVNAGEQSYVDRSGLCITREGFAIYFWGESMGPDALGEAMKRAHCERGMHLDMNSKHTQFEYYNVQPSSVPFADLGRRLSEAEFETRYPGVRDFHARGRLLSTRMEPQSFPRYLETDPRDFFYLTLRPTLPGPNLADGTRFEVRGLPQPVYPWAFARARVGAATLLRIDATRAIPAPVDTALHSGAGRRLAVIPGGTAGGLVLFAQSSHVGLTYSVGTSLPEGAIAILRGVDLASRMDAPAALGVDAEGFLVYAERGAEAADLAQASRAAGVTQAIALESPLHLVAEGSEITVAGEPAETTIGGIAFLERTIPYTAVLHPEVRPMPYASWGRIQDTRLRYIPEPGPRRFNQPN